MQTVRSANRMPQGEAKERILDAAEELFANSGLDGVSFRDLAGSAGVSLSAIHYHFGSKILVLSEIFDRRARALVDRRRVLLEGLPRDAAGHLPVSGMLDAFLRPAFEVTHGDRNDLFNRLLARLAVERSDIMRTIISRCFDENDLLFINELKRALPHLTLQDVHWRFHFLVGAMIYTMSDSGQLVGLSQGQCTAADTKRASQNIVESFTALFQHGQNRFATTATPVDAVHPR